MIALLAIAAAVAVSAMAAVWALSVFLRNAGIVDVAWSALFALLALLYGMAGAGDPLRRTLAAGMMAVWSLRLASHLWRRVVGHIDVEDGRYAKLRESWGAAADRRMFWFFQFQGATNVVLSLPVLIAASNREPRIAALEWIAVALWCVALAGESVADAQLQRFKANAANRGKVLQTGLWRFSRHPNYFFEWLIWCAFALFALASPRGWMALVCPLLMFWFLYKVTGIPATEEQAVRTKGDAYRAYQRRTSPFIPWFPKAG